MLFIYYNQTNYIVLLNYWNSKFCPRPAQFSRKIITCSFENVFCLEVVFWFVWRDFWMLFGRNLFEYKDGWRYEKLLVICWPEITWMLKQFHILLSIISRTIRLFVCHFHSANQSANLTNRLIKFSKHSAFI